VHNWTVEQTTEWLATNVELPQYIPNFIQHGVTGATLPRLAVNNMHYLGNVLGIKDPIHKQKIALKAMDVVLFGPPKDYSHHVKDLILVTLLLGALIGCWYAYRQNKNSRRHLRRMMKDMEGLHKAELALDHLQVSHLIIIKYNFSNCLIINEFIHSFIHSFIEIAVILELLTSLPQYF
ncbi:Stromal interaction molecule, partial [Blattella germanica]